MSDLVYFAWGAGMAERISVPQRLNQFLALGIGQLPTQSHAAMLKFHCPRLRGVDQFNIAGQMNDRHLTLA
jgi:hypothetical protein